MDHETTRSKQQTSVMLQPLNVNSINTEIWLFVCYSQRSHKFATCQHRLFVKQICHALAAYVFPTFGELFLLYCSLSLLPQTQTNERILIAYDDGDEMPDKRTAKQVIIKNNR